ncbi:hypothetical protein [Streptomyces misionensis]|uniref:hypothetical protein n=1 Tax=Streptomyces misionensis TaxID=67331 RepID=UPI0036A20267
MKATTASSRPAVMTLHNRDLPAADRFDWFCDLVAQDLAPHTIASKHAHDFKATLLSANPGQIRVSAIDLPPGPCPSVTRPRT